MAPQLQKEEFPQSKSLSFLVSKKCFRRKIEGCLFFFHWDQNERHIKEAKVRKAHIPQLGRNQEGLEGSI